MALLSSSCPPGEQLTWHLHTLAICVDVCPLIISTFVGVNFPLSILGINGWRTEGLCLSIGQMLWDCETVGGRQFRAANLMTLQPIDTTSRQCFWARVQMPSAHALPHPDTNLNLYCHPGGHDSIFQCLVRRLLWHLLRFATLGLHLLAFTIFYIRVNTLWTFKQNHESQPLG